MEVNGAEIGHLVGPSVDEDGGDVGKEQSSVDMHSWPPPLLLNRT